MFWENLGIRFRYNIATRQSYMMMYNLHTQSWGPESLIHDSHYGYTDARAAQSRIPRERYYLGTGIGFPGPAVATSLTVAAPTSPSSPPAPPPNAPASASATPSASAAPTPSPPAAATEPEDEYWEEPFENARFRYDVVKKQAYMIMYSDYTKRWSTEGLAPHFH